MLRGGLFDRCCLDRSTTSLFVHVKFYILATKLGDDGFTLFFEFLHKTFKFQVTRGLTTLFTLLFVLVEDNFELLLNGISQVLLGFFFCHGRVDKRFLGFVITEFGEGVFELISNGRFVLLGMAFTLRKETAWVYDTIDTRDCEFSRFCLRGDVVIGRRCWRNIGQWREAEP